MPISYVVVVMLENRSYDNVLGWLYNPSNPVPYNVPPEGQALLNGLTGNESNPSPGSPNGPAIPVQNLGGATYNGLPYPATCIPMDDPGEYFNDIAQQINGGSLPTKKDSKPYADYEPGASGQMQGFTTVKVSDPPSTSDSVTIQVTSANGATAGTLTVNFVAQT